MERVGYVTRIENFANSCERKQVDAVSNVNFTPGTGRNDSMTDRISFIDNPNFESFEVALNIEDFLLELS